MRIEYQITKKDFENFHLFNSKNDKEYRKNVIIARYIVPLIITTISSAILAMEGLLWLTSINILWIFWIVFYKNWGIKKRVVSLMEEGKDDLFFTAHSMEIGEDGLSVATKYNQTKIKWKGINRISEDQEYYFVFLDSFRIFIIPKRAFSDKAQEEAFVNMINDKINGEEKGAE